MRISPGPNSLSLSDFIGVPGIAEKAFRLGVEKNAAGQLVKLSCYVNCVDLARFGVTAREVTCVLQDRGTANQCLYSLEPVDGEDGPKAFFVFQSKPALSNKESIVTFRLVASGTAEQYAPYRFDARLGQQLWTAAVNGQLSDVVFQVEDRTFSAHKFVLAARSPVFRAMFNANMVESRTGKVQIVDVDPEIFEEFLYFLYTGQPIKPMSTELGMLAEKYQGETLTSLCRSVSLAVGSISEEGFKSDTMLKKIPKHSDEGRKISRLDFWGSRRSNYVELLHTEVYTGSNVIKDFDQTAPMLGEFFHYHVARDPPDAIGCYSVKFYSSSESSGPLACKVAAVKLLLVLTDDKVADEYLMEPLQGYSTENPLQIFRRKGVQIDYGSDHQAAAATLRFVVYFASTLEIYHTQLRDSFFAQELWSSRINKEWTDVEFQVGDKTFPAHRALLAARCPALAALVPAESSPSSSPGIVPIPDVDPVVFEEILYFLYTGSVRATARLDQHFYEATAAYKLETLSTIALASPKRRANLDQQSEFIMSNY